MATCRECLHFNVCADENQETGYYGKDICCGNVDKLCEFFTPKSDCVKRERGEWISVKDRLPDKEGTYLTYTDENKMLFDSFCIYPSHNTKFWVGGNGKVTHWQPLPEPPKEREEI